MRFPDKLRQKAEQGLQHRRKLSPCRRRPHPGADACAKMLCSAGTPPPRRRCHGLPQHHLQDVRSGAPAASEGQSECTACKPGKYQSDAGGFARFLVTCMHVCMHACMHGHLLACLSDLYLSFVLYTDVYDQQYIYALSFYLFNRTFSSRPPDVRLVPRRDLSQCIDNYGFVEWYSLSAPSPATSAPRGPSKAGGAELHGLPRGTGPAVNRRRASPARRAASLQPSRPSATPRRRRFAGNASSAACDCPAGRVAPSLNSTACPLRPRCGSPRGADGVPRPRHGAHGRAEGRHRLRGLQGRALRRARERQLLLLLAGFARRGSELVVGRTKSKDFYPVALENSGVFL